MLLVVCWCRGALLLLLVARCFLVVRWLLGVGVLFVACAMCVFCSRVLFLACCLLFLIVPIVVCCLLFVVCCLAYIVCRVLFDARFVLVVVCGLL